MTSPGLQICMDSEGYALLLPNGDCVAYWDKLGNVWTIGFGVTGADVKKGVQWTRTYAETRLSVEWKKHQAGVLRASPILIQYPNRLEAITDFAYNLGVGRYQASTCRRYVDQRRWTEAANELPKWNLAGGKVQRGLTARRAKEQALFLRSDAQTTQPPTTQSPSENEFVSTHPEATPKVASEPTSSVFGSDLPASSPSASHSSQTGYSESDSISTRLAAWLRSLFA